MIVEDQEAAFEAEVLKRIARNCMDAIEAVSEEHPDVEYVPTWGDYCPKIVVTAYNGVGSDEHPEHDGVGFDQAVSLEMIVSRRQIERELRAAVAKALEAVAKHRETLRGRLHGPEPTSRPHT